MKKHITIHALTLFLIPMLAFAAFDGTQGLIRSLGGIVNSLISLVAALALLYFFWGLARFILRAGDEKAREEGKQIMMWGIIALFIMVSVWGIVRFFSEDLGFWGVGTPDLYSGFPNPPCNPDEEIC